jgi:hypothetical protein
MVDIRVNYGKIIEMVSIPENYLEYAIDNFFANGAITVSVVVDAE